MSLIPNPLHPAIVHLPVAIAVLLPAFVIGSLWFIRRGARPRAAWVVTAAMSLALLVSGWVALQTGEQQEERVEDVVAEASIHQHEEAADLFLVASGAVFLLAVGGLAAGRVGNASRWLTLAGTLAVFGAGWNVGHSGGMLVYRDGAASAYAGNATNNPDPQAERREEGRRRGEDRESDGR